MEDNELYNLSMEVRRRTSWIDTRETVAQDPGNPPYRRVVNTIEFLKSYGINYGFDVPVYTIEYILAKIPRHIVKKRIYHLTIMNGNDRDDNWIADYFSLTADDWLFAGIKEAKDTESDSVLKALLKLVIALHDLGQLDTKTAKETS